MAKNPGANAGDLRDTGSIPGSGRCPGKETATHPSILAWRIPWIEEPGGGLQFSSAQMLSHVQLFATPWGYSPWCQRVRQD